MSLKKCSGHYHDPNYFALARDDVIAIKGGTKADQESWEEPDETAVRRNTRYMEFLLKSEDSHSYDTESIVAAEGV